MNYRLATGLALLCISLGLVIFSNSTKPDPTAQTNLPASAHSIINLSNEMMEAMIADGTYSAFVEASTSTVIFRVRSGGPTRISGKLAPKGTLQILNPAGIIVEADAGLMSTPLDFHSTL